MTNGSPTKQEGNYSSSKTKRHALRFYRPHLHLVGAFGNDAFGHKAEAFARYFGTPQFLILQTIVVFVWMLSNALLIFRFDPYPFILLNLAFSLQAAYAAPLILLAQTRQADRDKVLAEADAQHREEIAAITNPFRSKVTSQRARVG